MENRREVDEVHVLQETVGNLQNQGQGEQLRRVDNYVVNFDVGRFAMASANHNVGPSQKLLDFPLPAVVVAEVRPMFFLTFF